MAAIDETASVPRVMGGPEPGSGPKPCMRRRSPLLLSIAALVACGRTAPAPVDPADVDLEVAGYEALTDALDPRDLADVEALVGWPAGPMSCSFGRASATDDDGDPIEVWLARVDLPAPAIGAHATVAVDAAGEVVSASVTGLAAIDSLRHERWRRFVRMIVGELSVATRNRDLSPAAVSTRAESDDDRARYLARTRRDMLAYGAFLGVLFAQLEAEAPPSEVDDVLEVFLTSSRALEEVGPLVEVLGQEGAQRFANEARATGDVFREIDRLVLAGSSAEAARLLNDRFDAGMCNDCHTIRSSPGSPRWRPRLRALRQELGVADGVAVVGYDVPLALGDDGELSRAIAIGLRAAVLSLDRVLRD